ncbi:MarR family transcriptional regulator [Halomarina rubra]|uniref:MarR family transcriptional regulator n=1 Tax=Halomarina rubra TaxID=2071873 RepID=A0ABD6AY31_9EURY|nr:MarR family transcriptional regulator [Halomarina rubra]
MTPDDSDTNALDFDRIDEEISEDQAKLLATIHAADEGILTGRLREAVSVPSGSMHYHLGRLEEWELVDVVGRQAEGGGSPSKCWDTTDRGGRYLERPGPTAPTTFQDLVNHIEDLERDLDRREERIKAMETDITDLKSAYNTLASAVENQLHD